jgi:hypothetical protein
MQLISENFGQEGEIQFGSRVHVLLLPKTKILIVKKIQFFVCTSQQSICM